MEIVKINITDNIKELLKQFPNGCLVPEQCEKYCLADLLYIKNVDYVHETFTATLISPTGANMHGRFSYGEISLYYDYLQIRIPSFALCPIVRNYGKIYVLNEFEIQNLETILKERYKK